MKRKKITTSRTSRIRRERDPIPWKYCVLTLVCGLLLVLGFFTAARLHFSSMDYGFKNAKLRREVEHLKTERRRMILRREMALSGIDKAAKKIGFRRRTADNIEVVTLRKPLNQGSETLLARDAEKSIKAFTNSKTLIKQDSVRLQDLEKKISKTVINEPRGKIVTSTINRKGKPDKKGRRMDLQDQSAALIVKKK